MTAAAEWTIEEANARLAAEGYPPIRRLPADPASLASWKRIVDAKREIEREGKMTEATLVAVSSFCHCYKCPAYPRGELAVYCLGGKSDHHVIPVNCKCPSCEVYKMGSMFGRDYFCTTGVPAQEMREHGGAKGVALRLLSREIEKGNPGKRIPERLMSPPQLVGKSQEDVAAPEKVPGW